MINFTTLREGISTISLASFLMILLSCQSSEPPLSLDHGKIADEYHRREIGQLRFFTDWVAYEDFGPDNFATAVNLSTSTELNARMYLDKTLTAYLHDLAPALSVRELCAAGSFQFTFSVDGEERYVNNLQTGAGSCEYKNETTVYGIPLRGLKEVDHWGRFLWMKFLKLGGGEEALAGGYHELYVEVRPYIDLGEVKTGPVIASGRLRLSSDPPSVAPQQIAVQPIAATDRFTVAPKLVKAEVIEAMNLRIASRQFEDITSVVALKNGQLVLEEYFDDTDRNTLHDTRSVGKTFAGALLGRAIADGHLGNLDQSLIALYPRNEYSRPDEAIASTSLSQLLTMTSGLDCNDGLTASPGQEEKMYPTKDWVRFALGLPGRTANDWSYCTAGTVLLGDILHRSVPGGLEAYADQRLFSPLGIKKVKWQYTTTGTPNTAGSVQMSSLDLAAFGQHYLSGGSPEIVPPDWVKASISPAVARNDGSGGHYGYLLWIDELSAGQSTYTTIHASGNGGNSVVLLPELELVVVVTATAYGKPYAHQQVEDILRDYVIPAAAG